MIILAVLITLESSFSEIILAIVVGIAKEVMVKNKEYVGITKVYKLIAFVPTILVKIILIIRPNTLVDIPLIINIKVDIRNLLL